MARVGSEVIWPGVESKTWLNVHQEDKLGVEGSQDACSKAKGVLWQFMLLNQMDFFFLFSHTSISMNPSSSDPDELCQKTYCTIDYSILHSALSF